MLFAKFSGPAVARTDIHSRAVVVVWQGHERAFFRLSVLFSLARTAIQPTSSGHLQTVNESFVSTFVSFNVAPLLIATLILF